MNTTTPKDLAKKGIDKTTFGCHSYQKQLFNDIPFVYNINFWNLTKIYKKFN